MCADIKRESCKPGVQFFNLQRLVSGLHLELKKSPGSPIQRHELAGMTSAGQEFILKTCDVFTFNLISVTLFAMIIDERFRIGEAYRRAFATTHS